MNWWDIGGNYKLLHFFPVTNIHYLVFLPRAKTSLSLWLHRQFHSSHTIGIDPPRKKSGPCYFSFCPAWASHQSIQETFLDSRFVWQSIGVCFWLSGSLLKVSSSMNILISLRFYPFCQTSVRFALQLRSIISSSPSSWHFSHQEAYTSPVST